MTLFYAIGGGMGHISRSLAMAEQLCLQDFKVVTALQNAEGIIPQEHLIVIEQSLQNDLDSFKLYLSDLIEDLSPKSIYIDSFPLGILGELQNFPWPFRTKLKYVARLIQWEKYRQMFSAKLPDFSEVIIIEDLYKSHLSELEGRYRVSSLSIEKKVIPSNALDEKAFAVICHSGQSEELSELCKFALELKRMKKSTSQLFLISTQKPHGLSAEIKWQASSLARQYFAVAEFIVTACGFNLMNECLRYKSKHYFMPFERKFDDQFYRAEKYRDKTGQ
ncbi:MAG: hypothetical protein NE330_03090 [Lentisphaeraceae bacterium]|nr:hypothetical protein [Lentisphaeraceae bacterium]